MCLVINAIFVVDFLLLTHKSEGICVQKMINAKAICFLHYSHILVDVPLISTLEVMFEGDFWTQSLTVSLR